MKQRAYQLGSILVLATTLLTISLWGQVAERQTPSAGRVAPAFTATSVDGKPISLSAYKGNVVLLEFWSSTCPVCVADLPAIKQLLDKYSSGGLRVLGISVDQDRAALDAKISANELRWDQLMDGKGFEGEIAKLYGVQGTPTYFVIDRAGRIAADIVGGFAANPAAAEKLETAISEALAGNSTRRSPVIARDTWQRPAYVMDELGLKAGSAVADVGAGDGYFTLHLADRVGAQGQVFAVDINNDALETLENKAKARSFSQITTILGTTADPRLPEGSLDAILIVNAYHEMTQYNDMLRAMYRALKPGGRLGIIETAAAEGLTRAEYEKDHRLPEVIVKENALSNGFVFRNKGESFFHGESGREIEWYFVIFQK